MQYALATPGKRLRPALCVTAYRVLRPEPTPDAAYRLACALEIVHTYSLVHDDLPCMDDDDLRRGRPTVHVVYGPGTAVLAGAALIPVAVRVLDDAARELALDAAVRGRLAGELCRAGGALGMVGGQWLDLRGEHPGVQVDADELERIHRLKTGALLAASLRIGAIAGGGGRGADGGADGVRARAGPRLPDRGRRAGRHPHGRGAGKDGGEGRGCGEGDVSLALRPAAGAGDGGRAHRPRGGRAPRGGTCTRRSWRRWRPRCWSAAGERAARALCPAAVVEPAAGARLSGDAHGAGLQVHPLHRPAAPAGLHPAHRHGGDAVRRTPRRSRR